MFPLQTLYQQLVQKYRLPKPFTIAREKKSSQLYTTRVISWRGRQQPSYIGRGVEERNKRGKAMRRDVQSRYVRLQTDQT